MTDRSDATVMTISQRGGGGRRLVAEPRADGDVDLVEKTLTKGGDWRTVGREVVDAVAVESGE